MARKPPPPLHLSFSWDVTVGVNSEEYLEATVKVWGTNREVVDHLVAAIEAAAAQFDGPEEAS